LNKTYLLCESVKEGLVIIDQHAAHERVVFERLKGAHLESKIERQPLLVPLSLDLSLSEAAVLERSVDPLLRLGFEVDRFSGNTFVIRAVPLMLVDCNYEALLQDMMGDLSDLNVGEKVDNMVDPVLASMACHGSVRAGKTMPMEEIKSLLAQLDDTPFGTNCPHGRPIFRKMSIVEIEKMFGRR